MKLYTGIIVTGLASTFGIVSGFLGFKTIKYGPKEFFAFGCFLLCICMGSGIVLGYVLNSMFWEVN